MLTTGEEGNGRKARRGRNRKWLARPRQATLRASGQVTARKTTPELAAIPRNAAMPLLTTPIVTSSETAKAKQCQTQKRGVRKANHWIVPQCGLLYLTNPQHRLVSRTLLPNQHETYHWLDMTCARRQCFCSSADFSLLLQSPPLPPHRATPFALKTPIRLMSRLAGGKGKREIHIMGQRALYQRHLVSQK